MSEVAKWSKPKIMNDADLAFPARGVYPDVLPSWEEIPEPFKRHNKWTEQAQLWFYGGLNSTSLQEGAADAKLAVRHIHVVLGCFGSKHEHKMAGAGYLMSLWFKLPTEPSAEVP